MDYRIEHAQTDEILRVRLLGVSNESNANSIAQDIPAIVDQNDATQLLVDVRDLKSLVSPADSYWHVQKHPHYTARVKIAMVDVAENRSFDALHDTMSKNRGFNTRYFYDLAEVEQWLST
jgi:phospholipase C